MKKCAYCGRENDDDAVNCSECGTEFVQPTPTPPTPEPDPVTVATCQTLFEAEMIVSELEAAGITALIPDEFAAEAMAFNLNAIGHVRVQVSPKDYDAAKDVIEDADRLKTTPPAPPPLNPPELPPRSNDSIL